MYEMFNCIDVNLGGKCKTNKRLAKFKNNLVFINTFVYLCEKALARYDFEDLPKTVDDRVLKMALLYHGSVCFFDKEGSILALPATPNSNLNLYGNYKSCFVYGRNGFNEQIPLFIPGADESNTLKRGFFTLNIDKQPRGVYVRENKHNYPFINYCFQYAEAIADTYRTLDVVRQNIKRPFVIAAEEQLIPTIKKFFDDRNDNMDYIVSSGIFPADKIQILPFETQESALKAATDIVEWYMNQFDEKCYKNSNANPDKKERLLVDEVNSNNQSRESSEESFRKYFEEQLDYVNECLGTSIKLKEVETNDAIQGLGGNAANIGMGSGRSDSKPSD